MESKEQAENKEENSRLKSYNSSDYIMCGCIKCNPNTVKRQIGGVD
jgi:hypothetical protein